MKQQSNQADFKAPQSIDTTSTTTNSREVEKVAEKLNGDVQKGDYPVRRIRSLAELDEILIKRNEVIKSMNLPSKCLDLLVTISKRWVLFGRASTVYSLSGGNANHIMMNYDRVVRLSRLGLVEVVGTGEHGSNQWAPSNKGKEMLRPLMEVA